MKSIRLRPVLEIVFLIVIFLALAISGCAKTPPPAEWSKTGGVASSGKYRSFVVTDLDNDTHPDVAGASSDPGNLAIWYGNGSGNLTAPQFLPFKADVRAVAAGDFNSDGRKDLVMSVQRESSGIMVWLNQTGRKWKRGEEPIRINNYEGVQVGDLNRDGFLDIIAANATSETEGGIQVWLGNGHGGWTRESGPTVTGQYMDAAVTDFNKDGRLDIAGTSWGNSGAVRVWLGDGTGNWTPQPPVQSGNFNGISLGDLNRDGNIDIFAGSYREGIHVFIGDGTGNFAPMPGLEAAGSYWRAIPIDLDGDKYIDVMASCIDGRGLKGWRNQEGKGWVPAVGGFPNLGNYYDIQTGDLDGDGTVEIITANFGEGIKILSGKEWPYGMTLNDQFDGRNEGIESEKSAEPVENDVYTTENGYEEYKVGAGDILQITFWEAEKVSREEVEVGADGRISFSFVEDLQVNGMTLNELDRMITDHLSAYIKNPRIDIRMKQYLSKWVSVLGPGRGNEGGGGSGVTGRHGGRYYLDGKVSLIDMLSGTRISRDANLREIKVTRKNGRTLQLNIYKAMTLGDKTQNIILDQGDSIYVPLISKEGNRVFIFGEIAQPGAYPFTGSAMTLIDAVANCGGYTVFAKPEFTKIVRGDKTNPEVISVDLKKLIETGDQSQNVALMDGDLVYIPRSAIGDVNLFVERLRPILRLISIPSDTIEVFPAGENLQIDHGR